MSTDSPITDHTNVTREQLATLVERLKAEGRIPDPTPVVSEHDYVPNTVAVEVTDQGLALYHYSVDGVMYVKPITPSPPLRWEKGR